jgi:two-component system KDP operon response regulator KdpE
VLQQLRTQNRVPVIVLSARQTSDDKVEALDEGADDYVSKPFGIQELLARVRVVMRRLGAEEEPLVIESGALRFDVVDRTATRDGIPVHLTPTEWCIVDVLVRHSGRLVTQSDLLHEVWGPSYRTETNYLRVYLAQLRRKLEPDPGRPRHFITKPGLGYRFVV